MPLHICQMGPVPPPWGGVQTHIIGLRDQIRSRGDRCSIVNLTRHRQPDHDDLYFPNSAREVMARLDELKPDVVHVHFGGTLFWRQAALFVVLSLRRNTRNVFTFHSGGFPSSPEGLRASRTSMRGFALRQLDAVIGVNQALVDVFLRYGVKPSKAHMIEPFGERPDASAAGREELPADIAEFVTGHSPVLLAVGLLEPEYGLDVQLEAFSAIRAAHPRAGLLIIGSGSLHGVLQASIRGHEHSADILLAGDVPRPKTLAVISRADLLLRTTHYDGDALSVREALALGTRVLATDNGMRPSGVTLLERLDPTALASAVDAVLLRAAPPPTDAGKTVQNPLNNVLMLYDKLTAGR